MAKTKLPSAGVYVEQLILPFRITDTRGDVLKSTWLWYKPAGQILVNFHPTEADPDIVQWFMPDKMLGEYLSDGQPVSNEVGSVRLYPLATPPRSHPKENLEAIYGKERLARTMGIRLSGILDGTPTIVHLAANPEELKVISDALGVVALTNEVQADTFQAKDYS